MSSDKKIKVLEAHGVETWQIGCKLCALAIYTYDGGKPGAEWIDITTWTAEQVYSFLGY